MHAAEQEDLPTLLVVGRGDPMQVALEAAIARYTTYIETVDADAAKMAALTAAPDLIVLIGDAAKEHADEILKELGSSIATSVLPVVIISETEALDRQLHLMAHGGVELMERSPSADFMARKLAQLARELPERNGEEFGELAEATVDDLVSILSKELRGGILSVTQADGKDHEGRSARFVLKAGRPVTEAIKEFVEKVRPLVAEARPLHFEFHEGQAGRFDLLDSESESEGDLALFDGRRVLLIERNPATADALAQELRALNSTVVVADGEGAGLERARTLGPELVIVDEQGVETWAFSVMRRIRRDPLLRWASVLVIRADELMPKGEPPRTDRLAGSASLLVSTDDEIRKKAQSQKAFDIRLETIGPFRLVRALAGSGQTIHVSVKNPKATVELDLAEGLIAGAQATFSDKKKVPVHGSSAIAALLELVAGRVHVERREAPTMANLLTPVDDCFITAAQEIKQVAPSDPPPKTSARSKTGHPPATDEGAELVTELRTLVSQLKASIPDGTAETRRAEKLAAQWASAKGKGTLLGMPAVRSDATNGEGLGEDMPTAPVDMSLLAAGPRQGTPPSGAPGAGKRQGGTGGAGSAGYKPPAPPRPAVPKPAAKPRKPATPAKPPRPVAAPKPTAGAKPAAAKPAPGRKGRRPQRTIVGMGVPAPPPPAQPPGGDPQKEARAQPARAVATAADASAARSGAAAPTREETPARDVRPPVEPPPDAPFRGGETDRADDTEINVGPSGQHWSGGFEPEPPAIPRSAADLGRDAEATEPIVGDPSV